MSIDLKPLTCNNGCQSCYENELRDNLCGDHNPKKIIKEIKDHIKSDYPKKQNKPTVHGGEPLLFPMKDLEKILKLVYAHYNSTGIQTSLLGLKEEHIKLFKKYNTHVGISIDGPGLLNSGRFSRNDSEEKIINQTNEIIQNIKKIHENYIDCAYITVLRSWNIGDMEKTKKYVEWVKSLDVCERKEGRDRVSIRMNFGVAFNDRDIETEEVKCEQMANAFLYIADEIGLVDNGISIPSINDIIELMMGGYGSCSNNGCDPWHTTAEIPLFVNGSFGNCLKSGASRDGVISLRADNRSFQRSDILKNIPQDENGCKDCRYWKICQGGCPGTAIEQDYRNRTKFCKANKIIYENFENRIRGLFPNIKLTIDDYNNNNQKEILSNIEESTWKIHNRKYNTKDKYISIEKMENGKMGKYDDSNDPRWRKLNPTWAITNQKSTRTKK